MNARAYERELDRELVRLYKRHFNIIKRGIHREIRKAIRKGEGHAYYWVQYKDVNSELLLRIRKDIIKYFEKDGFYFRKYHFARPIDTDLYDISWGKEIENQKHLDKLHEQRMEDLKRV